MVGATLADLGKPKAVLDGIRGVVRLGTFPNLHQELLWWSAPAQAWISKPRFLMGQTRDNDFAEQQLEWGYYVSSPGTGLAAAPGSFWTMAAIPFAGEMFAAGFDLQMMLRGEGRGNGTYALQIAPWFFEYGVNLGVDNKLSLNNDSGTVPFPLMPGLSDVASNGPEVTIAPGTTLPADTTSSFTLTAATAIPFAASPAAGAGNFVAPVSGGLIGVYYLSIEHASLDRPIRLNYTGISGNTFTGCTVAFNSGQQAASAAKINNLAIPTGAVVHQARQTAYAPSGANPSALTSWSGTAVAAGDGNIGYGPILATAVSATAQDIETGWKTVRTDGSAVNGEGGFYRSFASGMIDRSRPHVPTKHILYATFYSRLLGVPNGTTGPGQGHSSIEARYRWVGIPG